MSLTEVDVRVYIRAQIKQTTKKKPFFTEVSAAIRFYDEISAGFVTL